MKKYSIEVNIKHKTINFCKTYIVKVEAETEKEAEVLAMVKASKMFRDDLDFDFKTEVATIAQI